MKNNEKHVNTLNNQWKIIKNILKIMEESLKNNELTSSKKLESMKTIFKTKNTEQ